MTGCRLALTLEACAGQSQRTNDYTMMCRSWSRVAVSCALLCFGTHCPYLGSCGCWHSSPLCDCKTQAPSSGWLSSGATVNCRGAAVVPCQVPCPVGAAFLSAPSFRKGQPLRSYLMRSDLARVLVWAAARPGDRVASAEMCFLIDLKAGSLRSECPHSVGAGSFPGLQMAAFSPCPPVAFVLCTDGEGQF